MIQQFFNERPSRDIPLSQVVEAVRNMTIRANTILNTDVREGLTTYREKEESPLGQSILGQLLSNATIAEDEAMPICQDTGIAVFFVKIGQDVRFIHDMTDVDTIKEGSLEEAINEGVRRGYTEGYLRKSIVKDPFNRVNTGDNTPAVIHYEVVAGDGLSIDFAPKGIGSENMSRIYMLKPSEGIEGVKRVVLETIEAAGPNACPPMVVGVGVGGTFEKATVLSKKALLRPIDQSHEDPVVKQLEEELLELANATGIGPQGLGGRTTVLKIQMLTYPTHIAGLPVAINISCHATRHSHIDL